MKFVGFFSLWFFRRSRKKNAKFAVNFSFYTMDYIEQRDFDKEFYFFIYLTRRNKIWELVEYKTDSEFFYPKKDRFYLLSHYYYSNYFNHRIS